MPLIRGMALHLATITASISNCHSGRGLSAQVGGSAVGLLALSF